MTEYCDRETFRQVYGHYPPEDGSLDPAVAPGNAAMGESQRDEATGVESKMVTPVSEPRQVETSGVAETKTVDAEEPGGEEPEPQPVSEPQAEPETGHPATE